MVKKKGKSKRTTLKDKYKIQKRIVETQRKRKKQAKRDAAAGVVNHKKQLKKKDPGIPNSWPFKQDLLKDIQRTRERQQQLQAASRQERSQQLQQLRAHQAAGGTARTVQELLEQAQRDQEAHNHQQNKQQQDTAASSKSDGSAAGGGQPSRRAYLRELKKVVDTADVLLQVLDARNPVAGRLGRDLEHTILSQHDKRMVLVLNKIDLVPHKRIVQDWLTHLRRSHPTIAIQAGNNNSNNNANKKSNNNSSSSTSEDATTSTTPVGMDGLLQLLKNYARTGGGSAAKTTIVVGVIGYPNVGKSSVINALTRSRNNRHVSVSAKPGHTTALQEVVLDRHVRLLDSPGVVFDDGSALLGNCVDADSIPDPIPAVTALLQRCNHHSLVLLYNIPDFPEHDTMMFLALVAKSYGRVLKGGIPDKVGAARAVLKDWNTGKIPYYTPAPTTSSRATSKAIVVSKMDEEFDLSKFDDAVLKTLKNEDDTCDELDFVKLEPAEDEETNEDVAMKDFLEDDDDEMEQDEEDEDEPSSARAKLAQAEDYDFDDMM